MTDLTDTPSALLPSSPPARPAADRRATSLGARQLPAYALWLLGTLALLPGCSGGGGGGTGDTGETASEGAGGAREGSEEARAETGSATSAAQTGALAVTVTFAGEAPAPEPVAVDVDVEHCSGKVRSEALIVDPESRGLRNVVVRLEGVRGPRKLPDEIRVTNRDCAFEPHVQVATRGSKIVIENADPILHTTHPYMNEKSWFNVPLRKGAEPYPPRPIREVGVMKIKCDVHSWMEAWVVVHDNSYVARTDEKGSLSMDQIPPGTYDWVSWHETLGEQRGKVTVRPGETTQLELSYGSQE